MLRQLVPTAATIAMLVGTETLEARVEQRDVELAAQALGQQLIAAPVTSAGELDGAFTVIVERGAKALVVGAGALLTSNRARIVASRRIGRPAFMRGGSSKARNQETCRSCNRPNSSWSST